MTNPLTLLCMTSSFKGEAFLREAKRLGCRVLLLTEEKHKDEAWPNESIDERFLMPDMSRLPDMINAVSYLCRSNVIDLIIPLDEYEVETAASLREHLILPGMGRTDSRFFRDKLSMRFKTSANGIPVPEFTGVFNYDKLREYMSRVPPPWLLKPRTEAGTMGIKKINDSEELWRWLDQLGDRQSNFLLEHFIPGGVYHVDSVIWDGKIQFVSLQQYGQPPMEVSHGGGIFRTFTLPADAKDTKALKTLNAKVVKVMGLWRGVTHAEYIKANDGGKFYFLEIAARVGGAHISDLIEQTTGLNPWTEWARIEVATARGETYELPPTRQRYGGLLVCLARQEWPDLSGYQDPEIIWRLNKKQHAGLITVSDDPNRVQELLNSYVPRFQNDFMAVAPPKEGH